MALSPYDFIESESSWWRKTALPVILLVIIAFASFLYISDRRARWATNELNTKSVKTRALLNNEFKAKTKYGRTEYYVTYSFQVNGQEYEGSATVDQRPSNRVIEVAYLPSDPSVNRLEDKNLSYESHFWGDLGVGIGTAAGIGLASWIINAFFGLFKRK